MNRDLEDYRLLRLAQLYERAYEQFVLDVADTLADEETRRRLQPLLPGRDEHARRLGERLQAIVERVGPERRGAFLHAALRDIVEVEQAAREFYLQHADGLHDRRLVDLFHDFAREEAHHASIAQEALDAHEEGMRRKGVELRETARPKEPLPAPPLWEGVSDYGMWPRRPEAP